ncbi:hypothetical protein Dimus_005044 [Dionaea muscipula]
MAAKLLHTLADDNPDLQKQIGCMTGIFQIFDRHHILSGRRLSGQSHKRLLPPGNSHFTSGSMDVDPSNNNQETTERNSNKYLHDKRVSAESSRASFSSSSRSSSFSSLDCGRMSQPEPTSLDRITFPETPAQDPVITQPSASPRLGRHSLDLRDVVKDSMYRESRGLSVQAAAKEQGAGHVGMQESSKHVKLSKPVDGSTGVGVNVKHGLPADLKESLRVLAKLREAPRYYKENEVPKSIYELKDRSVLRDAPRYSCDGRETSRLSQKVKDLPRLSLDSRESRVRGLNYDSKSTFFSRNMQRGGGGSNERVSTPNKSSVMQTRAASVVVKLMGLEALPDVAPCTTKQLGPIKTFSAEDSGRSSIPSKSADMCRSIQLPTSPRGSRKDPASPWGKNQDVVVMKPVASSKIPMEPAPWKHVDGSRASLKQGLKQVKSPSVYSELDKRLKDLEFKQSAGKDLRALKQIIEAMQVKVLLETTKASTINTETKRSIERRIKASDINPGSTQQDIHNNHAIASMLKQNDSSTAFDSPIVIMKPAKLVQNRGIASSIIPINRSPGRRPNNIDITGQGGNSVSRRSAKDQIANDIRGDCDASSSGSKTSRRNSGIAQTSMRSLQLHKDNTTTSFGNLGSTSPRLMCDKRSRPPTPESNKRSEPTSQPSESGSPGGRRRPKSCNLRINDDQLSEGSCNSRNFSCHGDDVSLQSDNHSTADCSLEVEVTGSERPMQFTGCNNPSSEASKCSVSAHVRGSYVRLSRDNPARDCCAAARENTIPSPVSVLDASAYREDCPSPVKQVTQNLQGGDQMMSCEDNLDEQPWDSFHKMSSNGGDHVVVSSEMSRQKLQSIDNLVEKLRRLNSTHDEGRTDYIASLCENSNPDHRYVSEILLASGLLLRDLSSGMGVFQLYPSGHPINPELFFVLEQTKAGSLLTKPEKGNHSTMNPDKLRRKLIFDTLNELLARRFTSAMLPPEPWLRGNKLSWKTLNGQKLLRGLCAEIDRLQPLGLNCSLLEDEEEEEDARQEKREDGLKGILSEDVMHRSGNWMGFYGDIPVVVLDVERSIFKDLVDEIVIGEAAGLKGKCNRHRRQLFSE